MILHVRMDLLNGVLHLCKPPYGGIDGLTKFTGNQHNEDWEWDEHKLKQLTESKLLDLWLTHRPAYCHNYMDDLKNGPR